MNLRYVPVLAWLVFVAACVLGVSRTQFSADLSAFLPRSASPAQQVLVEQLRNGLVSRLILIGLEGAEPEVLAGTSRKLAAALRTHDAFLSVANGEDAGLTADREFLWRNRYLLSPAMTPAHFTAPGLRASLEDSVQLLGSPAAMLVQKILPSDPSGELLRLVEQLEGQTRPNVQHGVWFSSGAKRALLVAETRAPGYDIDGQERALDLIRTAFGPASREGRHEHRREVAGDRPRSLLGSHACADQARRVAILAHCRWTGRHHAPRALPVAPRASARPPSGRDWRARGCRRGQYRLRLGARHYPRIRRNTDRRRRRLRDLSVHPDARGSRRQCNAATNRNHAAPRRHHFDLRLRRDAGLRLPRPRTARAFFDNGSARRVGRDVVGASGFAAAGFHGARHRNRAASNACGRQSAGAALSRAAPGERRRNFSRDPARRAVERRSVELEPDSKKCDRPRRRAAPRYRRTRRAPSHRRDRARAAVGARAGGRDVRDTRRRSAPGLARKLRQPHDVPAERVDAARPPGGAAGDGDPARKPRAGADRTSLQVGAFREPFIAEAQRARHAPLLERSGLDGTALALKVDSLLVRRGDGWAAILPLRGVSDAHALRLALAKQPGASTVLLDLKGATDELFQTYRKEATVHSLAGAAAILVVLLVALRSPRRMLAVVAPLAAAVIVTFAALLLLVGKLSIFHLVGLLLVVAVGSNYALFFERYDTSDEERSRTIVSVLFATLSTILGFGVLSFSSVPVLSALGSTVALGGVLCFAFSAIILARRAPVAAS